MLVSVVLLNWNGQKFLKDCIDSVLAQTFPDIELIVIDNASSDGSPDWIESEYLGRLTLVRNDTNTGFSRAMNQGFALARGEYLIPLNFDVIMEPTFVEELVRAAGTEDKIGSVSGKLIRFTMEGKTRVIDSTGHLVHSNRYVINRGEGEIDEGQYDTPEFVFGTCGGASLYRRSMLEDTAFNGEVYDESFFIMLEDVDLDWRAQLRGWRCAYTPTAVAYHFRGAGAAGKSRLVQRHYYKNRYLIIWKNDKFLSILKFCLPIAIMDFYLWLDILFTAPIGMLQACADIIRLLPLTLRKRKHIQSNRVITQKEIEAWFLSYDWTKDIKRKLGD